MARLGKYELIRRLTSRGITERYLAREAGEPVIVYRLLPELCDSSEVVRAFLAEARAVARLADPNTVGVREVGKSADGYFFVGDHVRGFNLSRVMDVTASAGASLPLELALFIVARICAGLHELHMLFTDEGVPFGLVHGNVHPENVLLTPSGEVKLRGLGLGQATAIADRIRPDLFGSGWCALMSPEQAARESLDPRSDIFSAGALLYELISQDRLFARDSATATREAVQQAELQLLSQRCDDLPEELERIVARALARDRRQRYITAQDMQVALDGVIRQRWQSSADALRDHLAAMFGDKPRDEDSVARPPPAPPSTIEIDTLGEEVVGEEVVGEEVVAAQAVAAQAVDMPSVAAQAVDMQAVDRQAVDRQAVDRQAVAAQAVDRQAVDRQAVAAQAVDRQLAVAPRPPSLAERQTPVEAPDDPAPPGRISGGSTPIAAPATVAVHPLPARAAMPRRSQLLLLLGGGLLLLTALVVVLLLPESTSDSGRVVLVIESQPAGATAYVDGRKRVGKTPLTLSDLTPGHQHHVVLMADDHHAWKRFVTLAPGERRVLQAQLTREATAGSARLVVDVEAQAKVYVDGEFRGAGPVQVDHLQPGVVHGLTVTRAGYEDRTLQLVLRPDEERQVKVELQPQRTEPAPRRKQRKGDAEVEVRRAKGRSLGSTAGERVPSR